MLSQFLRVLLHKRIIAILVMIAIWMSAGVSSAKAHAALVRSEPPDNAILAKSPQTVQMWFNEPIAADFSSVRVLDVNGKPVKLSSMRRDPSDPKSLILTLPDNLPDGVYSFNWRVLSEADGHFTQGLMVIGVGAGADLAATGAVDGKEPLPIIEGVLRWVSFSLLAGIAGSLVVLYLVLTPSEHAPSKIEPVGDARRRIAWLAIRAAQGAVVAGFGLLIWQTVQLLSSLPDTVSFWDAAWQLTGRTRWGLLWVGRQSLLLIVVVLLSAHQQIIQSDQSPGTHHPRKQTQIASMAAALIVIVLFLQSLTAHAAAVTPQTAVAVAIDTLHLITASIWIGGLLALAVGMLPLLKQQSREDFLALARIGWQPFGRLAAPSVGLVLATGIYSTGRQVATPDAMLISGYGQMLMGKIGLMLIVGFFGLLNSMLLHPAVAGRIGRLLHQPAGWLPLSLQRLPLLVGIELTLGMLVYLLVGVLTASSPARGPEYTIIAEELLESLAEPVDDLLISFSAKPNKPGQNVFTIRAVSRRRPPPAEVLRVITHFTYLAQDLGTVSVNAEEQEPGVYRLGGSYFSLAGLWHIEVAVRRRGMEDTVAEFYWTVPPASESHPVIISNKPWESGMTWLAFLMLIAVAVATTVGWQQSRKPPPKISQLRPK